MTGCRWREDVGFEGQCESCRQWWPLGTESWVIRLGLRRCRACLNEERATYVRKLREADPEMRARHRDASRANQALKRPLNRDSYLEYQRRWWATHHVRLMAEAAERHVIKLELEGRTLTRRSSRIETAETLAYRAAYRKRWIAQHGPVIAPKRPSRTKEEIRADNREWMRAYRARKAA